MSNIASIVFDLGDVLIDWNPRYLYRKLLPTESEVEWFLKNICNDEWNKKHDEGQAFEKGIDHLSKLFPEYSNLIKNWYDRWEEMLGGPIDGTVEILAELKNLKIPLYILSNWSAETYPKAEEMYDFLNLFDGKVISGNVGKIKPDPEIFYILIKKFNLNPKKTIFIDDKIINIKIANSIGFQGIHFQNPQLLRKELKKMNLI